MRDFSPGRWERVEALYDEALERPAEEREAFLDEACAGNAELKSEVLALLRAGDEAGSFLEGEKPAPVAAVREALHREPPPGSDLVGRHVGPYRIERPIGRGGMGQVYLAVRDDDVFMRWVAVKVIRRGMDSEEILHRFRTEQRILASLAHPNIARLLDGGVTDDGLSYLVMEYVDGQTITEWCRSQNPPLRARLEVFRTICSAVQYAHQNLVVHRDLKPTNILVTADDRPILLDFGIAKVLNPNLPGYQVPMTRTELRVMTPEYASPEQVRGLSVTTASDIYQLGVLLYELLTGVRPHETEGRTRAEIERLVLEREPEKPSTALSRAATVATVPGGGEPGSVARLRRLLAGDLDRIVLMALRKEPSRRYASADRLQEDIRRYLAGLPVEAQSDTWAYRSAKFVRRHPAGVVAAVALTMLLVAVAVLSIRFAVVTGAQADRVAQAARRTEEVRQFLVNLFEAADPAIARGRPITVLELLQEGAATVENDLAGQPDVQAEMLGTIGAVYRRMNLLADAEPFLERALAMRRSLYGERHELVAASLVDLAELRALQSRSEEAEGLHREALAVLRETVPEGASEIGSSLNNLGVVVYEQGRFDEAVPLFEEALAIREKAFGESSREVAETLANLAYAREDRGDLEGAEREYRRAISIQVRLLGDDHPDVLVTRQNLGVLLMNRGDLAAAETIFRQVLDARRRLFGEHSAPAQTTLNLLGRVLQAEGQLDEAEAIFRSVLAAHRADLGDRHYYVGRDLDVLAGLLVERQRWEEAEAAYIEALSIYRETLDGADHPRIVEARSALSKLYASWGRPDRSAAF